MTRLNWISLVCAIGLSAICQAQTYTITTAAGGANPYFFAGTGDGGLATSAGLANLCYDVALDGAGNLYIVAGSLIRKVTSAGIISTVAGGGTSIEDYVPATTAEISPIALASDASGNLFIADTAFGNSRIRKVDTTGTITTVAGGAPCCAPGDGGPASDAYIGLPYGVAVDPAGNIYIAQADGQNNLVRMISAANRTITTVAGGGAGSGDGGKATAVSLAHPTGVAVDLAGNLYIAEANGNRVRKVSIAGIISTVAGSGASTTAGDGGLATQAGVDSPYHVAVDSGGNIYITEINDARVRRVTSGGTITTIFGTGVPGFSGDGGPATSATLDRPAGIAVANRSGLVYIADATSGIARVRLLVISKATATVTLGSLAAVFDGTAKAATATTNPPGLLVTFTYNGSATAPSAVGSYTVVGTIDDSNYAGSATGTLVISKGTQTIAFGPLSDQTIGLSPPPLSATASSGLAVMFASNSKPVCTVSGVDVTLLTVGTCSITASQAGNSNWTAAASVTRTFTVIATAVVSLSPNAGTGTTVTFKAVYSDAQGVGNLSELLLQVNTTQSSTNACYVYYQPQGNHLYLANNAGAWMTPALTPGEAGMASNSQCTLNAAASSVAMAGNDLTLSVALTFSGAVVGSRNVYLYAAGLGGQNTGWVREGIWVPNSAGPPAVVSLSPDSGAGNPVTFKAVYSDPNGAGDLNEILLQVNTSQSGANACYVYYQPQGNHLYLADNAGTAWMTPALTPGVTGTAVNSQCTLNAGTSSVSLAGNNLTLSVALNFGGGVVGSQNVYLYAAGFSGHNSGWVREGAWVPMIAGPPAIVSLSASSGGGTTVTLKAVYSDPNGAGDLATLLLQINSSQSSANGCYVYYQPQGDHLYLADNAGNAWMTPLTPGMTEMDANNQCTLYAGSSSVSTSGNDLTLSVAMSFSDTFVGVKDVYLYAAGISGENTGWVKEGTWTP
jgi:sugar lactone lactonase YvrE